MHYKIEFQYLRPGNSRPDDYVQKEDISSEVGQYVPIPAVGDSVILKLQDNRDTAYKVVTRNFSYMSGMCIVNIVVSDIPSEEMGARLKV